MINRVKLEKRDTLKQLAVMKPIQCLLFPILKRLITLAIIFSIQHPLAMTGTEIEAQRQMVEFQQRDGLPNFIDKLNQGKSVSIAYLGGSITAQSGWRVQSQQWLEGQYPNTEIRGIHAAIGGTGSDLGVFRVEQDALSFSPDLLFVEFAVNDANAAPDKIIQAMEGIVRKTWRSNPKTDICFVYTITHNDSKNLANGTMKRSTKTMEKVADHYGIPSIHMGYQVALMEKDGTLVMKTNAPMTKVSGEELDEAAAMARDPQGRIIFAKDGVHPYAETGHVLYTQALIRSFEQMKSQASAKPHELPTPLRDDNLENAQQIPLSEKFLTEENTNMRNVGYKHFTKEMPQVFRLAPGATLSFKFKGTYAAIYDLLGHDGAELEITLDGKSWTKTRMDGYCTYQRLARLGIGDNLENTIHEVRIRVLDTKLDKREILFERNRSDFDKNPKKYASHYWYAGAIFIVGEIIE